jgi:hypothetical protein
VSGHWIALGQRFGDLAGELSAQALAS